MWMVVAYSLTQPGNRDLKNLSSTCHTLRKVLKALYFELQLGSISLSQKTHWQVLAAVPHLAALTHSLKLDLGEDPRSHGWNSAAGLLSRFDGLTRLECHCTQRKEHTSSEIELMDVKDLTWLQWDLPEDRLIFNTSNKKGRDTTLLVLLKKAKNLQRAILNAGGTDVVLALGQHKDLTHLRLNKFALDWPKWDKLVDFSVSSMQHQGLSWEEEHPVSCEFLKAHPTIQRLNVSSLFINEKELEDVLPDLRDLTADEPYGSAGALLRPMSNGHYRPLERVSLVHGAMRRVSPKDMAALTKLRHISNYALDELQLVNSLPPNLLYLSGHIHDRTIGAPYFSAVASHRTLRTLEVHCTHSDWETYFHDPAEINVWTWEEATWAQAYFEDSPSLRQVIVWRTAKRHRACFHREPRRVVIEQRAGKDGEEFRPIYKNTLPHTEDIVEKRKKRRISIGWRCTGLGMKIGSSHCASKHSDRYVMRGHIFPS